MMDQHKRNVGRENRAKAIAEASNKRLIERRKKRAERKAHLAAMRDKFLTAKLDEALIRSTSA